MHNHLRIIISFLLSPTSSHNIPHHHAKRAPQTLSEHLENALNIMQPQAPYGHRLFATRTYDIFGKFKTQAHKLSLL